MPSPRPLSQVDTWFKSSYSGGNTTECVQCAHTTTDTLIRDSKRPDGPVLAIQGGAWRTFIEGLASA
ncbi:DUF397 domain-containing protein [Streptomyces sp. NPDC014746]|uniref:DUF397 domain-containing protein n=1 Tax=Streptomyces sp. NPDC014746 TaxID=3364904 RepID=UPI0036FE1728